MVKSEVDNSGMHKENGEESDIIYNSYILLYVLFLLKLHKFTAGISLLVGSG